MELERAEGFDPEPLRLFDTTPRHDKEAATLAWSRTIEFFKKCLA